MKQHPIRKMQVNAQRCDTEAKERLSLRRSVKPLLDALDDAHQFCRDEDIAADCDGCALLAAWKAKP